MPGLNLTRDEARERAALLTVESYDVDLDLTTGDKTFRSVTRVRFSAAAGATTFIDLVAPTVHAATLNGRALDPLSEFDGTRVQLTGLAADNELVVDAECLYMHTGEGLHRFVDPVDGAVYLYTQFEVIDARRMFTCFDQPDLKATYTFAVTAPAGWQVVSNSPTPEPEALDGERSVWRFATTPRMSTYITALIAGDYHAVRSEYRGIPMGVFCRKSLASHLDADEILDVTRRGFDYFEELFARPYPFEKYDQLFVPEFNAGAMENAGAVTFLEDYVFRSRVTDASYERRAETILHELAHMWFGNLVTMRWWDDLWLNESFATFASIICQAEATRWDNAWTTFCNVEKTWAAYQDQLPSTHPIAADIRDIEDVEFHFDGITYAKGASVLRQLVAWVGRDAFVEGVRCYFDRHAWGNTELSDLLGALEETSGRDLKFWAEEWLERSGNNTLRPQFAVDADGRFTSFEVLQSAPAEHPHLRSHRIGIGLYERTYQGLTRVDALELDVVGAVTEVPQLVGRPQPALVLLNDGDLTYSKIRLDPESARTLVASIQDLHDPLARALCWAAAWDMMRDAEMTAGDYLTLVVQGLSTESDVSVLQSLLRQALSVPHRYTPEHLKQERLASLADALLQHTRESEAGSDRQLALVRAFAAAATTDDQLDEVARLLDGATSLPGLTVDTDLRWTLLQALVARGRRGESAIDAELSRDDTATGRRQTATARALVPTSAAKEEAWAALVDSDELPNALVSATVAGFAAPEHGELMRPFVDRYFDALERIWAERTNEIAQSLVTGLYPEFIVEQQIIDRTEAYLAERDPVPALRRLLVEAADRVARALRVRAQEA